MTEARIEIVVPTLSKTIEGKIIQANPQRVCVILDEPRYAEELQLNHTLAV
jgi:hypothetical protein